MSVGEANNSEYISEKGMGTYKIYFVLGSIYESLGEIKKAKISYLNTLQWNQYHTRAGTRLIKILLKEQKVEQVINFLNIIYDNSNPSHLLMLAYLLFEGKHYYLCHEMVNRALDKGAKKDQVNYLLALCGFMEGNKRKMNNYIAQIEDKESYNVTDVDFVILSLKEIVEQLNEGYEKFPEASFFTTELKRLNEIIQLYETGD